MPICAIGKTTPALHKVASTVVPMGDYGAMADAVAENTVMIISESPTNPYLNIVDIDEVVRIAQEHGVLSVKDSTFATPYNSRPRDIISDLERGFAAMG